MKDDLTFAKKTLKSTKMDPTPASEPLAPATPGEHAALKGGVETARRSPYPWAAALWPWRLVFLLIFLLIGAGFLVRAFFPGDDPTSEGPADPRLTYAGPFQNIHPDVQYVGMDACTQCHADIAASYVRTPMANTLIPVRELARSLSYDQINNNPFTAFEVLFKIERQGDRLWQREARMGPSKEPIYQLDTEAHYAIGSGNHGHSYLTVLGDSFVFQTPISWFSRKKIWDLSPGFGADRQLRPANAFCLFCHANRAFPKDGTLNQFETRIFSGHGIGCERCHGPGQRHVQRPGLTRLTRDQAAEYHRTDLRETVTRADLTIVNPRKLRFELREAVCQQCHLEGKQRILRRGRGLYDFRPGLSLDGFFSIFVQARLGRSPEADEDTKAVNHVEQMYLSRCFQRSDGDRKLGCISCHNPHQHVGQQEQRAHYRQRCQQCHSAADRAEKDRQAERDAPQVPCALPLVERQRQNQNDCTACHMPPYPTSDIIHAAATDHRIIRRPEKKGPSQLPARRWNAPLVPFGHDKVDWQDPELARDRGLAMVVLGSQGNDTMLVGHGVELLEEALQHFPDDSYARQIKALGLLVQKRAAECLAVSETVMAREPKTENVVRYAATAAQFLGKLDLSRGYWRRAVDLNPWMADYRGNLTLLLAHKGAWDEAGSHCREWLRLDPANTEARKTWIRYLLQTGQRQQAAVEFSRLEALRPANLHSLRSWFKKQLE